MKYLLSWVCRHLDIASWQELGQIEDIIHALTIHVSEIAHYQKIDYKKNQISFATIIDNNDDICIAQYNDEERVINLPSRKDAEVGSIYIIIQQEENKYRFATMKDLHAESKNHYISALYGKITDHISYFKQVKKQDDYVIKIDNTSINHRADLFSHRGLARELALIFNKNLIPESDLIFNKKDIKKDTVKGDKIMTVESESVLGVAAASGLFCEKESLFKYILNLIPLDITPHSYLVDLTNYVMFDIGQPMHVFDKKNIQGPLVFTDAQEGTLACLDNTTIAIKKKHTVIIDKNEIHSLVGIIGGKHSSISMKTKEIIIESASLKKTSILSTNQFYNKKTESSIRNEKGSSIYAAEFALLRFLKLIHNDFKFTIDQYQIYTSKPDKNIIKKITLSLIYLEKVIGIFVEYSVIENIFYGLGFLITRKDTSAELIEIAVPWWRFDISNEDDLIEEISRHIGYDAIPLMPPQLTCKGIVKNNIIYTLKKNTILITSAQEIISYGIANEEQKNRWGFIPNETVISLKNPYSDRQKYMATSFLPNFLDIIHKEIQNGISTISLFEINPLWCLEKNIKKEDLYYSYCFYEETNTYNFYKQSELIKKIFYASEYDLSFHPADSTILKHNLFSKMCSHIYYDLRPIGICGFIDPLKLYKENKKHGSIFAAEINLTLLFALKKTPLVHDQYPFFDISILLKKTVKIHSILHQLAIAFGSIMHIKPIDWFESSEWTDSRSVTIRIFLMNNDINEIYQEVTGYLKERGYTIR